MTVASFALLTLLVLVAGLLLREFATVARAHAPAQTRAVFVGQDAPAIATDIPKVIWTYWEPGPTTAFIQACLTNWRRFAPDHEVRLLDRAGVGHWLPELRADFDTLPACHQADWLQIQLLARHGGVWMEASTLLSRDLGWLHDLRARGQAEYVGFYIDRDTSRPELPIIESWFMASVPNGSFVAALAAAFDRALDEGAEALVRRLREQGRHTAVLQRLSGDLQPQLMQMAAGELLDRAPLASRLALLRAEDGPSAWLAAVGWRRQHHYARIALTHAPTRLPALLRLSDGDRAMTERRWLKGRFLAGSALIELLGRPHDPR